MFVCSALIFPYSGCLWLKRHWQVLKRKFSYPSFFSFNRMFLIWGFFVIRFKSVHSWSEYFLDDCHQDMTSRSTQYLSPRWWYESWWTVPDDRGAVLFLQCIVTSFYPAINKQSLKQEVHINIFPQHLKSIDDPLDCILGVSKMIFQPQHSFHMFPLALNILLKASLSLTFDPSICIHLNLACYRYRFSFLVFFHLTPSGV